MLKALALFGRSSSSPVRFQQKYNFQPLSPVALALGICLSLAVFGLAISYLFGANSYSAEGYAIKHLQNSISELSQENKKLSLKMSQQSSIAVVQAKLVSSDFVPVGHTKFVQEQYFTQR